jgi:mannose-6-phosphate isomerase-like protein (cupin superfamily)
MKGFIANIEKITLENENFREVLYTTKNVQLVLMSIPPQEEIGEETHDLDQFIRCESGKGKAVLDGVSHEIRDGFAIVVPAGMKHNITNTSLLDALKLYTLYSPPNHKDKMTHKTKVHALADQEDHFDGVTSE